MPDDMGVHPFVFRRLRGEFRYLFVFTRIPDDEARRLTPAELRPEFHRWWCAAHVF